MKEISSKALAAARKEAERNAPQPAISPEAAFVSYGIVGVCAVAVFVSLSYFISTEWAWIGTGAVCATVGWLDSHMKTKAHFKELNESIAYYKGHRDFQD
jgi:hypothetical protein